MADARPALAPSPRASDRKICYLSRRKGWTDPTRPKSPVSEVNLLAIFLGAPVWTLNTAWMAVFRENVPPSVASAYRTATARVRISEPEIRILQQVADRLGVELKITD